jgi:hypothetical protein
MQNVTFKLLASGREQSESAFFDETINLIDEAKHQI